MDYHVHFIAVPSTPSSLARGFGIAHHKYTSLINIRENLSGHLWQARFLSYPLNEAHVIAAIRYIERNPVRAGVVLNPEDYVWSSARAHALGLPDPLISPCAQLPPPGDWADFLRAPAKEKEEEMIRDHARNERPLGCDQFIKTLEAMTGRVLSYKRRGRKKGK
jgi:putative transposase